MSEPVRVILEVAATASESVLTDFAITHLRDRGYNVIEPHQKWEDVTEFLCRLGIHSQTLNRKLRPWPGRPNVLVHRGSRKRIVAILSNPDFDAYCVVHK